MTSQPPKSAPFTTRSLTLGHEKGQQEGPQTPLNKASPWNESLISLIAFILSISSMFLRLLLRPEFHLRSQLRIDQRPVPQRGRFPRLLWGAHVVQAIPLSLGDLQIRRRVGSARSELVTRQYQQNG